MVWKLTITALASQDINSIKKWYKARSIQALENFIADLTNTIETLKRDDVEHKPVHENYRRLAVKNFPYTIYYERVEKEGRVEVVAVLHNQRSSERLTDRLQ